MSTVARLWLIAARSDVQPARAAERVESLHAWLREAEKYQGVVVPLMDVIMQAIAGGESTVLFVEHDMEIVGRYADRVLAFYAGRIIADGEPATVLSNEEVQRYVTGGAA